MGFKINLDDVEPWKGGGIVLRAGSHVLKVVDEEIKEPGDEGYDGDHPVVILTLEAQSGEEKGGEIRDWVHITQEALGRVAQIYEAFQVALPGGDFDWLPLRGKVAKGIVREKPGRKDPSKTFSEVTSYVALPDGDAAIEALKSEFDADELPAGSQANKRDDDIPF